MVRLEPTGTDERGSRLGSKTEHDLNFKPYPTIRVTQEPFEQHTSYEHSPRPSSNRRFVFHIRYRLKSSISKHVDLSEK